MPYIVKNLFTGKYLRTHSESFNRFSRNKYYELGEKSEKYIWGAEKNEAKIYRTRGGVKTALYSMRKRLTRRAPESRNVGHVVYGDLPDHIQIEEVEITIK